jgi:NifU-like protein
MTSELFQEHFLAPRNVGELTDHSFSGRAGAVTCGAVVRVSITVDDTPVISKVKFKAAGCSVLVATASLLTEFVKGKTTAEAANVTRQPVREMLRMLDIEDSDRLHCAELASEALLSAITQYSDSVRCEWEGDEALICTCFCVSERTIEAAIQKTGADTIAEVTMACRAGAGCRSCWPLIEDMLIR